MTGLEGEGDALQYTDAEVAAIRSEFVAGNTPRCPRCSAAMTNRSIGGGSFGLGYARKRDWLICGKCRRSAIFDVARGTRN